MLRLPAAWIWDFWLAKDESTYHLFFLKASRALLDPERRHWRASIGHAVSQDLREWTEVADALVASDGPAADDMATWTGSVIRDDDGRWRMFYTGIDRESDGRVQRVLMATSTDLMVWHRDPDVRIEAQRRWYEKLDDATWREEAFRDPWVFREEPQGPWHMLITARSATGGPHQRGVVGHATSADLQQWTVQPALSLPDAGFDQLEVIQVVEVEGRPVLLFSCLHPEMSPERLDSGQLGGVWWVPIEALTGPFDIRQARRLTSEAVYSGRLVENPDGEWVLLAFQHLAREASAGPFVGELTDPVRVRWGEGDEGPGGTAVLQLVDAPAEWVPDAP